MHWKATLQMNLTNKKTEINKKIEKKMSSIPFVIERTYKASIEKVWRALTDKDQLKQWYFDLADFRPELGFEFRFEGGKDSRSYVHVCKITEVIAGKKISYSWTYEGYERYSVVTFELFYEGSATRLKLTHDGLATFPQNNPDFAKENFAEGWTYITGTSLANFVDNA